MSKRDWKSESQSNQPLLKALSSNLNEAAGNLPEVGWNRDYTRPYV
ncbi:hypothetical protein [Vagococcus salmoninarum]|nr:hypothetical protein [Vagococcus salmoninarum]